MMERGEGGGWKSTRTEVECRRALAFILFLPAGVFFVSLLGMG